MAVYNDDEPTDQVSAQQHVDSSDSDSEPAAYEAGDTKLTSYNRTQASLKESKLKVVLELTGSERLEDRFPLDLVAVLDVSGSMKTDDKIGILRTAMQFVIRKLSSTDRLAVVTYSTEAKRLYPQRLSLMTDRFQDDIIKHVKALPAGGWTNTHAGLEMGVKILNDRRYKEDRTGAILLMSDGEQSIERYPDARLIRVDQYPVYTFALGKGSTTELLEELSRKSDGGTFTDVRDEKNLSRAFALCLGGLLSVVVKDLTLTVKPFDNESRIDDVSAGKYYDNKSLNADKSVTISFGDLYSREVRKILLYLSLFSAEEEKSTDVVQLSYTYNSTSRKKKGKLFKAPPVTITVDRFETASDEEVPKVIIEDKRAQTVDCVNEARKLADVGHFPAAKNKMNEAKDSLESVKHIDDPEKIIEALLNDVEKLLSLMATPELYNAEGKRMISSFLSSQLLQRAVDGHMLHATPLMLDYVNQALEFVKDPSKPPPKQDDDLKEEKERQAKEKEENERLKREEEERAKKEKERKDAAEKAKKEKQIKEEEEKAQKERELKEEQEKAKEEQERKEAAEKAERDRLRQLEQGGNLRPIIQALTKFFTGVIESLKAFLDKLKTMTGRA